MEKDNGLCSHYLPMRPDTGPGNRVPCVPAGNETRDAQCSVLWHLLLRRLEGEIFTVVSVLQTKTQIRLFVLETGFRFSLV